MGILRREVFIASNFEEFRELRAALQRLIDACKIIPVETINLDQNEPHGIPPLEISLALARRSDVLVLLIGQKYGGVPNGKNHSYAHLEYDAGREANPTVLAFFARDGKEHEADADVRLRQWKEEVKEKQTISYLDRLESVEDQADFIFRHVQKALIESMLPRDEARVDTAEADFDQSVIDQLPAEEIDALERQSGQLGVMTFARDDATWNYESMIRFPAQVAASEQFHEASKAMELGDRRMAIQHLRRALELRPLDMRACYLLAKLLSTTRQKKDASEALLLALRAARMAEYDGREVWQAASLIVAAQAATLCGDEEAGLFWAKRATKIASWFAATHLELARQYVERDDWSNGLKSAKAAFHLHPMSLMKLRREPAFRSKPKEFQQFEQTLKQEAKKSVSSIIECENRLWQKVRKLAPDESGQADADAPLSSNLEQNSIMSILYQGRGSARRQLALVRRFATRMEQSISQASAEISKQGAEHSRLNIETERVTKSTALPKVLKGWLITLSGFAILGAVFGGVWQINWLLGAGIVLPMIFGLAGLSSIAAKKRRTRLASDAAAHQLKIVQELEANQKETLERLICDYYDVVTQFETATLDWHFLSPSTGTAGATKGDLVRMNVSEPQRYPNYILNSELLPEPIRANTVSLPPRQIGYQLLRVTEESREGKKAERWACYFDLNKYRSLPTTPARTSTSSYYNHDRDDSADVDNYDDDHDDN